MGEKGGSLDFFVVGLPKYSDENSPLKIPRDYGRFESPQPV